LAAPKKPKTINYDRAAKILCDAVLMGDREAAEKWKTTIRTIQRYRIRLETDDKLRRMVAKLQSLQDKDWASEIPGVLAEGMAFLRAAFVDNRHHGGTLAADNIDSLTHAIEALADIDMTRKLIAERLKDAED
jgi:hypothetical protein